MPIITVKRKVGELIIMRNCMWTIDDNDTLYDNWDYFKKYKEIAENIFGRSWEGIRRQAYKLGVELKNNYLTSNPAILNEARGYLDGLVLSDGNINCRNIKTGYYRQGCKEKGWLDKISDDLSKYEIECIVTNGQLRVDGFSAKGGSMMYDLSTRRYIEFKEIHDRFYVKWYELGKHPKRNWHRDEDGEYYIWQKIVPKDICLSSVCLANEYLGDGSCVKHSRQRGYKISLSTEGFLREDTIFLTDLLSEVLDIKCGINKAGVIGIYTQADISTFLNYIKDYKTDCYNYKFPENAMR